MTGGFVGYSWGTVASSSVKEQISRAVKCDAELICVFNWKSVGLGPI